MSNNPSSHSENPPASAGDDPLEYADPNYEIPSPNYDVLPHPKMRMEHASGYVAALYDLPSGAEVAAIVRIESGREAQPVTMNKKLALWLEKTFPPNPAAAKFVGNAARDSGRNSQNDGMYIGGNPFGRAKQWKGEQKVYPEENKVEAYDYVDYKGKEMIGLHKKLGNNAASVHRDAIPKDILAWAIKCWGFDKKRKREA